jgi:hypothetical protein
MNETQSSKIPNNEEQLEDILHHYLTVLERWKEDRAELAKQISDLGKSVVRLGSQLDKFNDVEKSFRQQVIYSIDHSSSKMAERIAQEFKQAVANEVNGSTTNLLKAVDKANNQLQKYEKEEKSNFLLFFGGLFILPIVTSLLLVWLIMPKPLLALSGSELQTYQAGQFLEGFWSKLSKREQKHLSDLSNQTTSKAASDNQDSN